MDHWSNVIENIPDEFISLKHHLHELIELQSVHDTVVPPFDRLPVCPPGQFLPVSKDFSVVTHDQIAKLIEMEKASRLQVIIDSIYRESLEREQTVGVL